MAFTEAMKLKIKKKAFFQCCLCHGLFVEVHHIVPQSEGGPDEEDNAAPLCPSCHETYGANPEKRKFIREARDFWYGVCEKRYATTVASVDIKTVVAEALRGTATKEDLERLSVQNSTYVLGRSTNGETVDQLRYSFCREEYIHPRIVEELVGWISDPYATITSVDLVSANRSNRFWGDFWVREIQQKKWVGWTQEKEEFSYSLVGVSASGVHMVQCQSRGGGSGVFNSVQLFAFDHDRALEQKRSGPSFTRERVLLKLLGSIGLGDRYSGTISYSDGVLKIGPDEGWFQCGQATTRDIPIR